MIYNFIVLVSTLISPTTLEITVEGVTQNEGFIRVAFYDSEEIHLSEQSVSYYHEVPVSSTGSITFAVPIPAGNYSIAVYHDINADKVLNKNLIGIPKEPYGFSNNVMGMFGPPSYQEAMISFPKTQEISISLR